MKKKEERDNEGWDLIHAYTRAQAIEDGMLIDVTETAREAGFTMPVALTAGVHAEYVAVPDSVTGQDESGRLWDVLSMLRHAIRTTSNPGSSLSFQLLVRNSDDAPASLVRLTSTCGPGDSQEPVLTVMLPGES